MALLLRGTESSAIADAVGFIAAPLETVVAAAVAWRESLGQKLNVRRLRGLDRAVDALSPRRLPWSREAFVDGGAWTVYLNEGSDPVPVTGVLSRTLETQAVLATHAVDLPHASTQFELLGPTGQPPLHYVRSLAASCEDGRWSWHTAGEVQPFEDPERYGVHRICDRLDRSLLIDYLRALGMDPDGQEFSNVALLSQV